MTTDDDRTRGSASGLKGAAGQVGRGTFPDERGKSAADALKLPRTTGRDTPDRHRYAATVGRGIR